MMMRLLIMNKEMKINKKKKKRKKKTQNENGSKWELVVSENHREIVSLMQTMFSNSSNPDLVFLHYYTYFLHTYADLISILNSILSTFFIYCAMQVLSSQLPACVVILLRLMFWSMSAVNSARISFLSQKRLLTNVLDKGLLVCTFRRWNLCSESLSKLKLFLPNSHILK